MNETYLKNITFLIVDDVAFTRTMIRRVLTSFNAGEMRDAKSGEEAIEILESFDANIIIADWEMAPMDGIEFVGQVRGNDDAAIRMLPIIMLSGHSEMSRVAAARDAGVSEFVVKPFSATSLFSRIEAVTERPRQFVKTDDFFGPDRRRRSVPHGHEERRKAGRDPAMTEDGDA